MAESDGSGWICLKCNCALEYENTNLYYLGHRLSEKFLRCPKCKQVYIPEDVAMGKMTEVEESLEDK